MIVWIVFQTLACLVPVIKCAINKAYLTIFKWRVSLWTQMQKILHVNFQKDFKYGYE